MLKTRQENMHTTPTRGSHHINVYNQDSPAKGTAVYGTPIEIIPSKKFTSY